MLRTPRIWALALASALSVPAAAQQPDAPAIDPGPLRMPPLPSAAPWAPYGEAPYFSQTPYGALPQSGPACSPTEGQDTYPLPIKHYSPWFRPAAFAEDSGDNCQSRPWNPHGYGFPHRRSCERIDYTPYALKTYPSAHGPAYYTRFELQRCCSCQHCGH